jgi:hypothetical protein
MYNKLFVNIILIFFAFILINCSKKQKINISNEPENIGIISEKINPSIESENGEWGIEDYKAKIMFQYKVQANEFEKYYEFKEYAKFDTGEYFLLCRRSEKWNPEYRVIPSISLFSFNKNHDFTEDTFGFPMEEPILEAIAQGIHGIRLWDAPVFIGDFNNDGQKEIAAIKDTASAATFQIWSIDLESKNLVCYFDRTVGIGKPFKPTLIPVEFMRYKNMDGFKMLRMEPLEIPNVKYPYDDYEGYNGYKGLAWFFYKWDEREKEYVIVEEIDPYYSE